MASAKRPPTATTPRLHDVAARAGVTKSTASRILNGAPVMVRPVTRQRVEAAARELGYRPNPAARAINRSTTGLVGILVPDFANAVYSRILRGAVRAAAGSDLAVLAIEDGPESSDAANAISSRRIDGVIVLSARPEHPILPLLAGGALPCVFALRAVPGSGRNVVIDDAHASELAVMHLYALGHRRIGHIAGPHGIDTSERRAAGFRAAAAAVDLDVRCVVHSDFGIEGGAKAARRMLARSLKVTGIFTASLPQAIGTRAVAAELGYDVPGELSIISYDDLPLAGFLQPPLTAVRVPLEELGHIAFDALRSQLEGVPPRDLTLDTPAEIIVRSSTAKAP